MELYNGDCLNILKSLPDKSIDLVCCDPPYDIDVNHDGGKLYANKNLSKSNQELVDLKIDNGYDIETVGNELVRIMKHINAYFWCNKKQIPAYFNYYVGKLGCKFEIICYHKTNALPTFNGKYLTDTEYCLYFFESGHKLCHPTNYEDAKTYYLAPINNSDKKLWKHPTIKPLDIIKRIVSNSSKEGDIVLDCFMGSGTTGVACKELKRDFIGIEISKEYFDIAEKRISTQSNGFKFGGCKMKIELGKGNFKSSLNIKQNEKTKEYYVESEYNSILNKAKSSTKIMMSTSYAKQFAYKILKKVDEIEELRRK